MSTNRKKHIRQLPVRPFALAALVSAMVPAAAGMCAAQDILPQQPMEQVGAQDASAEGEIITSIGYAELMAMADAKKYLRDATITPEQVESLLFTAWQHALLQEAKIGFTTRAPDSSSAGADSGPGGDPGIRELSLGGIAFYAPARWTVWLNSVRITPDAIPDQVLDIKVSRSHIDIKWFDRYTNRIYPVRLRPHERFNLDSRIFLPGGGT